MTTEAPANEIHTERTYDAPCERVFAAWTRPERVDRWWGPRGFETVTDRMDFRVGGEWRYVMRHAEYGTFPNRVRYVEIVPNERIVYDHDSGEDGDDHGFRVEVTFEARDGGTLLRTRHIFADAEACLAARRHGAAEGGRQTLDRLAEHLEIA